MISGCRFCRRTKGFPCRAQPGVALGVLALAAGQTLLPAQASPGWFSLEDGPAIQQGENLLTTGIGGGTFDLNAFLGANRYYAAGITGQNAITFNLEAGHFWNGHETLQHVATNTSNFVNAATTFGGGPIAPLYDRHATWVASLIGGRASVSNPQLRQQGIAFGTDLRSAAIATQWVGSAYALGFNVSDVTYRAAYDAAYAAAQVINSSYGYGDPAGTSGFTAFTDARAFANPGTLHVVSAGNGGPNGNTVSAPGAGYNGLTVAALGGANGFNSVAAFSSRGPQDFGYVSGSTALITQGVRAAVDLAAPGERITAAFYGGQTGGNDPGLAGSTNLGSNASAYSSEVAGTSFSAPLVAGGAALLASAARTLEPLASNVAAASSMVVKALLLTGADKTAGWTNGQQLVSEGGDSFLRTTQSLDWAVGAGRMNLDRSFDLQLSGQMDVAAGGNGLLGEVAALGWDHGHARLGVFNDYLLPDLLGGSSFTATLSWMRYVDNTTLDDLAQADLNLSLWLLDETAEFSRLIARSGSLYNTVEHLHFDLAETGRYGLRVEYLSNTFDLTSGAVWGSDANLQAYGLAWEATSVPGPLPLAGALAAFGWSRRLRRRLAGATVAGVGVTGAADRQAP
jgi:hypothetical protein